MNKVASLVLVMCLLVLPSFAVNAVHAETQDTGSIRLFYDLYAPARVVVSFAYTKNVTIDVSTLKTSLYKATTSPVQLEFYSEDYDVYTVTMTIRYGVKVDQTIIMGIFEGGRAAKSIEIVVSSSVITLTMRISVVEAPRYPTADEISNLIWERWRNELNTFEVRQQGLITTMASTVTTIGSLAAIAFGLSIALMIVVLYTHRKVAELSQWGLRHEAEHRGVG